MQVQSPIQSVTIQPDRRKTYMPDEAIQSFLDPGLLRCARNDGFRSLRASEFTSIARDYYAGMRVPQDANDKKPWRPRTCVLSVLRYLLLHPSLSSHLPLRRRLLRKKMCRWAWRSPSSRVPSISAARMDTRSR